MSYFKLFSAVLHPPSQSSLHSRLSVLLRQRLVQKVHRKSNLSQWEARTADLASIWSSTSWWQEDGLKSKLTRKYLHQTATTKNNLKYTTRARVKPRKEIRDVTGHAHAIKPQDLPIFPGFRHDANRSSEGTNQQLLKQKSFSAINLALQDFQLVSS